MPNSQDRIIGYDLIKTFAIFMIVFYHLGGIDFGHIEAGAYYYPNFNKFLLSFCSSSVPLFLMVHGALILPRHLSFWESFYKAFQMLILFLFGKFVLQYLITEKCFSIEDKMVHFWFLGTLGMVYLFSYFLNRIKWLRIVCLSFLLFYPFLFNLFIDIILFLEPNHNVHYGGHDGFFTLYALVYFYLGFYFKDNNIQSLYSYLLIILGLLLINLEVFLLSNYYHVVYDGVNSEFPTIGALLLSLGIYCRFVGAKISYHKIQNIISFIGSNTLGIYMFHVLIIFLIRKYTLCESFNLFYSILLSCSIVIFLAFFHNNLKLMVRSFISFVIREKN